MIELRKVVTLAWRKFLAGEAGIEGMLFLREKTPSIVRGDQHQMIFDAGRVEGYKQAIDTISELLAVKQEETRDPSNDE
jgi:hypothetical protein